MKRVLCLLMVLMLVFSVIACAIADAPTTPTSDTVTTDPTADPGSDGPSKPESPTIPPSTTPTDPIPDDPEPDYLDLQAATQLTQSYSWYLAVGICCEFEPVNADLSVHLSDSQKQTYFNQQYRLLCCHTAEEVRNHINRTISNELQVRGYPDDLLFTDDQGVLYLIIVPSGYVSYRNVTIAESNDCLYAKTGAYAEDGWFADAYFTIETQNGTQIITQVFRTDINEIPADLKNLTFCTPIAP